MKITTAVADNAQYTNRHVVVMVNSKRLERRKAVRGFNEGESSGSRCSLDKSSEEETRSYLAMLVVNSSWLDRRSDRKGVQENETAYNRQRAEEDDRWNSMQLQWEPLDLPPLKPGGWKAWRGVELP